MKKIILSGLFLLLLSQFAFGAAATMYVTVAGAGDKSGSSWANAMGYSEWETDAEGSAEAGDLYWVYKGTYTLTSDFTSGQDGLSTSTIRMLGCSDQGTPPTEATGTNRPWIAGGSYYFALDDYSDIFNIKAEGTGPWVLKADYGSVIGNCYAINSSGTADRTSIYRYGTGARTINCESISTNGRAITNFRGEAIIGCNMHDSKVGCKISDNHYGVFFCLIDTCITGIYIESYDEAIILCNTIYNSTTGISATDSKKAIIFGNIINSCTTGLSWTTEQKSNYFDYNDYYNNTSNMVNVSTGTNSIFLDPTFTDAPNGNFTVGTNMKAKGFPGAFPGGLSTGYLDIGAVQRIEPAAGGGGGGAGFFFIQ
jgi:parallel beta-helix repeat protein